MSDPRTAINDNPGEAVIGWGEEEWQDWSNDLIANADDSWDDDVAQETIVLDYVRHLEDEVKRLGGCRRRWCAHEDGEACDHGYLATPVYRNGRLFDGRCHGTLGSRPEWMSPDQYDPCRCRLDDGHDGPHWCEHLDTPDPRDSGRAETPPEPDENGSDGAPA